MAEAFKRLAARVLRVCCVLLRGSVSALLRETGRWCACVVGRLGNLSPLSKPLSGLACARLTVTGHCEYNVGPISKKRRAAVLEAARPQSSSTLPIHQLPPYPRPVRGGRGSRRAARPALRRAEIWGHTRPSAAAPLPSALGTLGRARQAALQQRLRETDRVAASPGGHWNSPDQCESPESGSRPPHAHRPTPLDCCGPAGPLHQVCRLLSHHVRGERGGRGSVVISAAIARSGGAMLYEQPPLPASSLVTGGCRPALSGFGGSIVPREPLQALTSLCYKGRCSS